MIVNPPRCSLLSIYGPSVMRTSLSFTRTTVAELGGCSPPEKTHAFAAASSFRTTCSSPLILSRTSGGGSGPPGWYTLSRDFVIAGSPPGTRPLSVVLTIYTNGIWGDRQRGRRKLKRCPPFERRSREDTLLSLIDVAQQQRMLAHIACLVQNEKQYATGG